MTAQEVLFIVAIVFFVLAALCVILAVVVFFVFNVPDVRADLSGKKRAAGVAELDAQSPGRDRRKGVARVEPTSGRLDSGNLRESNPLDNPLNQVPHVESVVSPAPAPTPAPAPEPEAPQASPAWQAAPQADQVNSQKRSFQPPASAEPESDDSSTTILPDDNSSTTILGGDGSATAILSEKNTTGFAAGEADDSSTTILPTEGAPAAAAGFVVVRKIVLRESENVITAS